MSRKNPTPYLMGYAVYCMIWCYSHIRESYVWYDVVKTQDHGVEGNHTANYQGASSTTQEDKEISTQYTGNPASVLHVQVTEEEIGQQYIGKD